MDFAKNASFKSYDIICLPSSWTAMHGMLTIIYKLYIHSAADIDLVDTPSGLTVNLHHTLLNVDPSDLIAFLIIVCVRQRLPYNPIHTTNCDAQLSLVVWLSLHL